jgi:hypothetical protein
LAVEAVGMPGGVGAERESCGVKKRVVRRMRLCIIAEIVGGWDEANVLE